MSREYKLEVIIQSTTPLPGGGVDIQQTVPFVEYSDTDSEHVLKNFHTARKVLLATFEAMEEMAQAAGYVTRLEDLPSDPGKPNKPA